MNDKDKHKLAGTLITLISGVALYLFTKNLYISMVTSFVIGTIAGVAKEFYDLKIKKTKFDWWDIGATMYGVGMGAIILRVLIDTVL